MTPVVRRLLLITFLAVATASQPAFAAGDDGVTYDPDSPAGTEYAIPLDGARDVGRGDSGDGGSGGDDTTATSQAPASPTLFGAGISAAKGEGSNDSPEPPDSGSGSGQPTRSGGGGISAVVEAVPRAETITPATSGPGGALLGGGVAAIVAALALGVGLGTLRRQRTE